MNQQDNSYLTGGQSTATVLFSIHRAQIKVRTQVGQKAGGRGRLEEQAKVKWSQKKGQRPRSTWGWGLAPPATGTL